MARSTIERLPKEIREEIGRLRQGGRTIDEILDKLRELGADVSRSAVGRHVKKIEEIGAKLRQSREIAEALVRELGDEPDTKVTRLNIEMGHTLIMRLLSGETEFGPEEVMFLTSSIQKLASARKTDADLIMKLQADADKKAMAAMETVAKKRGLTPEAIASIKEDFLGIRKAAS
ncbi:DUF3486 family protein [Roseomonas genomospecies 6]|uniref:DUF3486 family protein n=1 Tax=Roseomonas genomospecies 6 TaxID=214106 RepID=A0A9W7NFV3_9PROT|nr:DUF3486 family protein [Roseomonas genomospecies 6]KAA0678087.1 DUF3486 family protein [Roseomonas genomospecies 6]